VLAPPYRLFGSVITLYLPFWRSVVAVRSVGAPLDITREHYNVVTALLEERYLFWAIVGLLRRMRERSLQSLKEIGFKSLVNPSS
jgi:hypothetical protein